MSIKPTPENLRHYAEWWFWATETLGGSILRRRAAARAGMEAQAGGATVPSAIDSADRVFREGSELASSSDDPAQRYAELYVRARLARRLDPEAAHALAAEAVSTWRASSEISTAISPRTNITAIVAAVFLAVTVAVLAVAFFGPIDPWFVRAAPAFAACMLGMFTFVIGLFARSRIKYSGEAGGTIAGTSLGLGCLLAVVAGFAALVLFVSALGEAFAPVGDNSCITRNLGCPGESTASFIEGPCAYEAAGLQLHVPYSGSQLSAALAFLQAHPGQVSPITVSLGANDIQKRSPTDPTCLANEIALASKNLKTVLADFKDVSPSSEIIVLQYYNPFAVVDPSTNSIDIALNQGIASVAANNGARVADSFTPFNLAPQEPQTLCILTYFCTYRADIHPTDLGYSVIAEQFWAASDYSRLID